jgi:hypothetical protein
MAMTESQRMWRDAEWDLAFMQQHGIPHCSYHGAALEESREWGLQCPACDREAAAEAAAERAADQYWENRGWQAAMEDEMEEERVSWGLPARG